MRCSLGRWKWRERERESGIQSIKMPATHHSMFIGLILVPMSNLTVIKH